MSKSYANGHRSTGTAWVDTQEPNTDGTDFELERRGHSREDALSERQFVELVEGARELDEPYATEARVALYATGKLGLRGGELVHLTSEWIDWHDRTIVIPMHEPCTRGQKSGEVCGYCRARALDRLETNNLTIPGAEEVIREEFGDDVDDSMVRKMAVKRMHETNITYRKAISERWNPKTKNSVRSVPFDFDVRTEMAIETLDERWGCWPKSVATLNRRIDQAAEAAGLEDNVYPHALRATAASFHASRGVSPYSLMSLMGWVDIMTARSYIRASDETAAKEIRSKHR